MKKVRVGVIPAAGKGNRINDLPLTRILPKPMLPVLNKPILEYVLENMKKLSVEVVYMIVGYKKDVIKRYFGSGADWDLEIKYVEQKNPKGIAHAIGLVKDYVNEPFISILGDDLTITKSLENLVFEFSEKEALAVEGLVVEKDMEVLRRTCCVVIDNNGKVIDIEEKPTIPKSDLRGCGVYVFDPIVFEFIKRTPISPLRNEKEITNTLRLIAQEGKFYGTLINGINVNVNTFNDLMNAIKLLLNTKKHNSLNSVGKITIS
jgi:dTDP-glucose pyrophosphorylase